ncbi:MAG: ATP-dependent zinc metalloprotease FtsH [Ruminococcaceae bacterium]|nr:ATP-dependent zinc metalloprotease FtsH [Oscillospiraceae bacterium]
MKALKNVSIYIALIVGVILLAVLINGVTSAPEMSYNKFVTELIENDNVKKVSVDGNTALVELKEALNNKTLYRVKFYSQDVFESLVLEAESAGKTFDYVADITEVPFIVTLIPYILMAGIVIFFILFMMGQSQGANAKVMNFGKSRARLYTTSKIKFADVAGADEEKEEMAELVSFLKNPKKYADMGARIPKGVLMVGPPGTGKTYLAKAVAGEAEVPFFAISGSDFVEMYVGVGAARVRDLFEQAKKNAPCLIFIDEIDAVGRHRGSGLGGGHDEREQTLNQLLVEMDGFAGKEGIIIIAATNRPDILDPALTRPGRFDRKIVVNVPTLKARDEILKVHARNKPISEDVSLLEVAKITPGFTPADLENLLNEAALLAAREDLDKIEMRHIKEATFRVVVGPEKKSNVMTEKDKRLTAIHETGHAIAVKVASSTDTVDRVSIIPAGYAGGYTAHKPSEDKTYATEKQMIENIIVALGGRAAEELCLGEVSTGASSDLKSANGIAHNMVTKYGMSKKLTNMVFDNEGNEVFIGRSFGSTRNYSEDTAAIIDEEVKTIIDSAYTKVKEILTENMDKLNRIADVLMEKEKIEGEEFEALMAE